MCENKKNQFLLSDEDPKWWKKAVVYQIYPRSFQDSNGDGIGDLNGITSRLPYLKELGIDVIWLSPVYKSPNDDNGYDISDYQDIMDEFGTMEDFDRMLETAHSLGIRIMMDLVVNHTSDEHPWFLESKKSEDNPYRDYYFWREPKEDGSEPNNWGSCFSGPAWKFDDTTGKYFLHLFSKKQPDLNWDNPKVRDEVYNMMNWWVDKGIDGFRMDVISLISKEKDMPDEEPMITGYSRFDCVANGPHVHEYLQEMNEKVLKRRNLITVGETCGVTVEEAKKYANNAGTELSMVFQFDHMGLDDKQGCKWTDKKIDLCEFKQTMKKWMDGLKDDAWNSLYLCNHDQPRFVSRMGSEKDEFRELSAKMLGTCLHMMQGTPYIYQGEELGMTNAPFETIDDFRDLDSINAYHEFLDMNLASEKEMMKYLRMRSRDNARTPMQWSNEENGGFSTGNPWIKANPNYVKINAKEQLARKDSVFYYYQKLIKLRHEYDVITDGDFHLLMEDSKEIFAYERVMPTEKLIVLCNFMEHEVEIDANIDLEYDEILIANYENKQLQSREEQRILRPYETIVMYKNH